MMVNSPPVPSVAHLQNKNLSGGSFLKEKRGRFSSAEKRIFRQWELSELSPAALETVSSQFLEVEAGGHLACEGQLEGG